MRITEIIWKEAIVEKLAEKHHVSIVEVEELLLSKPIVRKIQRGHVRGEHVYAAMGQVASGSYLIVFFIHKASRAALPISARDMTTSERKDYARRKATN